MERWRDGHMKRRTKRRDGRKRKGNEMETGIKGRYEG